MDFEGMTDLEVDAMLKRLTAHAAIKLNKLVWRGRRGDPVPAGLAAEDIVCDALVALVEGVRSRNRAEYPRLEDQLRSIVDSTVSNHVTGAENRLVTRSEGLEDVFPAGISPEAQVSAAEYAIKIHDALLDLVVEDEQLTQAADLLWSEGTMEPTDLEERLEITKAEANNLKKRLRRAIGQAVKVVDDGGCDGGES